MNEKVLLLINPHAGQKRANRILPEIIRTVNDSGLRCETYVTNASGDATDYVRAHAGEYVRIICIGGDGTLNETLSGVMQSGEDITVGYIPAGTTNDYANSIGLSTDILDAAADAMGPRSEQFDMGLFNRRGFTYTASFGAFTKVSYTTPQPLKNTLGHLAYILAGIGDLASLRPYHARIETEEGVLEDDYILGSVCNSTSIGGVLKLDANRVSLNDGLFEVMLIHMPKSLIELTQILNALSTQQLPSEQIDFFRASRLVFDFDEESEWTLDGERAEPAKHVEIQNLHSAIRLALPEADHTGEQRIADECEEELRN